MDQYLALRKVREDKCLLMLGFSGDEALVKTTRKRAPRHLPRQLWHPCRQTIRQTVAQRPFPHTLFTQTLWEKGYAIDTLETAVS